MESGRACVTAGAARRTGAKGVEEEASSRENHFELRVTARRFHLRAVCQRIAGHCAMSSHVLYRRGPPGVD